MSFLLSLSLRILGMHLIQQYCTKDHIAAFTKQVRIMLKPKIAIWMNHLEVCSMIVLHITSEHTYYDMSMVCVYGMCKSSGTSWSVSIICRGIVSLSKNYLMTVIIWIKWQTSCNTLYCNIFKYDRHSVTFELCLLLTQDFCVNVFTPFWCWL